MLSIDGVLEYLPQLCQRQVRPCCRYKVRRCLLQKAIYPEQWLFSSDKSRKWSNCLRSSELPRHFLIEPLLNLTYLLELPIKNRHHSLYPCAFQTSWLGLTLHQNRSFFARQRGRHFLRGKLKTSSKLPLLRPFCINTSSVHYESVPGADSAALFGRCSR